eukprot:3600460-Lingulodinium_polyedra.AAC.1
MCIRDRSSKLWPCGRCSTMKTYHKLMTSHRPEHALPKQAWDDEVKYKRICSHCELELRTAEFVAWSR